jgi:hypothetical protein
LIPHSPLNWMPSPLGKSSHWMSGERKKMKERLRGSQRPEHQSQPKSTTHLLQKEGRVEVTSVKAPCTLIISYFCLPIWLREPKSKFIFGFPVRFYGRIVNVHNYSKIGWNGHFWGEKN